jgi:hypothetical protein
MTRQTIAGDRVAAAVNGDVDSGTAQRLGDFAEAMVVARVTEPQMIAALVYYVATGGHGDADAVTVALRNEFGLEVPA